MTTRRETPARSPKRVRIDENNNEVQVIRVDSGEPAPSVAARNFVKGAVASHPDAIQRIAISLAKEFVSLKARFQQKETTKTKLDGEANFIPRSAKVAFKLTAPANVMETQEFKTLSSAMDNKTKEYSEFCKKSIAEVAALVNNNMKKQITDLFRKGMLQLATLLLIQHDPSNKEPPVDYFLLYALTEMEQTLFDATFAKQFDLQKEQMDKLRENSDSPTTQPTVEIPGELQGPFALILPNFNKLLGIVFSESFSKYNNAIRQNETQKHLERQATKFLTGDATTATAMVVDSEPSADPKIIRELINDAVQKKTAKMQAEIQKLRDSVKRPPSVKNSTRGATSSSKPGASSQNKKQNEKPKADANRTDGKPKQNRRNTSGGSTAENKDNDSQKEKKSKPKKNGTPSQKKKPPKQQSRSKQS